MNIDTMKTSNSDGMEFLREFLLLGIGPIQLLKARGTRPGRPINNNRGELKNTCRVFETV
jgi:hypothetical protein